MNKLIFVAYATFVTYGSLRPMNSAPLEPWDKVGHFLLYAVFALLASRVANSSRQFLYLCGAIIVYSGILELIQSQLPGRSMSGYDLIANIIGVGIGTVMSRTLVTASQK
ncbi:MAG: VanZ family protein [Pseudomonadales bacterium]|nr:VanZ family protein [Halieaceae bacterium]MCP5163442.1 VanZ family protein [Pseudomonadales bacterium]MCP5189715.1 VanZ family protein [Pseudomonadales bacterium]MCP5204260.1 VanZ family protein [Pseudomonadales bacterium]